MELVIECHKAKLKKRKIEFGGFKPIDTFASDGFEPRMRDVRNDNGELGIRVEKDSKNYEKFLKGIFSEISRH